MSMLFKRIKDWATSITAFRTGDVIPVDGPDGTAKMGKEDLLRVTAQNALADNMAPAFDPTRTSENPYKPGQYVCYLGAIYEFNREHFGPWNSSHVIAIDLSKWMVAVSQKETFPGFTSGALMDFDAAEPGRVYFISKNANLNVANMPPDSNGIGYLISYKTYYKNIGNQSVYYIRQVYTRLSPSYKIWYRDFESSRGSFADWKILMPDIYSSGVSPLLLQSKETFPGFTSGALMDFDAAEPGRVYFISKNANLNVANMPPDSNGIGYLISYKTYYKNIGNQSVYYIRQVYTRLSPSYKIWYRDFESSRGSFADWRESISGNHVVMYIGQGRTYTTLRAGFSAAADLALKNQEVTVIVEPGIYDVVNEFMTELSDADNIQSEFGIFIGRNIHYLAMPGAKIKAIVDSTVFPNYGDAQFNKIRTYFNVFKAITTNGSFILENFDIEAKNTRYCVHDELFTSDSPQVHKYINCKMKHYADSINGTSKYGQCIGGGLGRKVDVVVDGGCYESVVAVGVSYIENGNIDFAEIPISWHNSLSSGVESSITIKNVLLMGKGYFRFGYYGDDPNKVKVLISGCRMYYPPLLRKETYDASPYDNIESYDYACDTVVDGSWHSETQGNVVYSTFTPNS